MDGWNSRDSCCSRGRGGSGRTFKRRQTVAIAILGGIVLLVLLISWLRIAARAFGSSIGGSHDESFEAQEERYGLLGNLRGVKYLLAWALLALELSCLP